MIEIKNIENELRKLNLDTLTKNTILNELSEIVNIIENQRKEIETLKRENNNQYITIRGKEDVIEMLKGMISGIVDNI